MATNVATTSSQSDETDAFLPVFRSQIEVDQSSGTSYGNSFQRIPSAYAESVGFSIGPTASEARFVITVAKEKQQPGGVFDHKAYEVRDGDNELSAIGPLLIGSMTIRLFSKVRISVVFDFFTQPKTETIWIGYVTDFEYFVQGKETSGFRVICQDARHLLSKTPCQGVLHHNENLRDPALPNEPFTAYIRDAEMVFNEGGRPNRLHKTDKNAYESEQRPRFCRVDLNRFVEDEGDPANNGRYANDAFVEGAGAKNTASVVHARKWLPGHVWNYLRNSIDPALMLGAGALYDLPQANPPTGELPPMNSEVNLPVLSRTTDDSMQRDFFEPRSVIGATDPTIGQTTAVSAMGEFDPTGQPMNEALYEVCRRVGNYSYAIDFTDTDTSLQVIRTTQGFGENRTLPVGIQGGNGGTGGATLTTFFIPTVKDSTSKPDVQTMNLRVSGRNYVNRHHIKGGPRWVQITFATVAALESIDDKSTQVDDGAGGGQLGQRHALYAAGSVPAGEWLPRLDAPTLVPGWRHQDQLEWLKLSTGKINFTAYPDVFRTWIVPEGLDWIAFWGLDAEVGYRRVFEIERQMQDRLLSSWYDLTLGIYRSHRTRHKIQVWRAYRGIRVVDDGTTVYGDSTTEHDPLEGFKDWYMVQSDFELLNDGRIGFRLGEDARLNTQFDVEIPITETVNVQKLPMGWNGLANVADTTNQGTLDAYTPGDNPRSFEMMITVPIAVDEQLWEHLQNDGTNTVQNIAKFGPPMEQYRNAIAEYSEERAIHSLVDVAFVEHQTEANNITLSSVPPVLADGVTDDTTEPRIFKDDKDEMAARVRMMANRLATPDTEVTLVLPYIALGLKAGAFISELRPDGDTAIPIRALVASFYFDFQLQQTTVNLATIR